MRVVLTKREMLLTCLSILASVSLPSFAQPAKPKIGFIGAGRIGSQLATFLGSRRLSGYDFCQGHRPIESSCRSNWL